jgi:hypothetical protein
VDFVTPFSDTLDVTVPMDPAQNQTYANNQATPDVTADQLVAFFEELQAGISEMEKWLINTLEIAIGLHEGDQFNILVKKDQSKNIVNGNPYPDVVSIFNNYGTGDVPVIVGAPGSPTALSNLVFASGSALVEFFYDIKEFLLNLWVISNNDGFGFPSDQFPNPSSTNPLLFKTNVNNVVVTYDYSLNAPLVGLLTVQNDSRSDVEVLGRQYGYNVDGSFRDSEWEDAAHTTLKYTYAVEDSPGVFKNFQYIYRQHYATDPSLPFTPTNLYPPGHAGDPDFLYYQYTNPGDEEAQAAFQAAFRALEVTSAGQLGTKNGTYFRWLFDWTLQAISLFVVQTAAAKGLAPQAFIDEFYTPYVYNTNFPPNPLPPIKINFRTVGGTAGSANSAQSLNFQQQTYLIRIFFPTLDPHGGTSIHNQLSTLLHEGSIGHGFDGIPKAVSALMGNQAEISWPATLTTQNGAYIDSQTATYAYTGPGIASIFEGWATFGEITGLRLGYYVQFDPITGLPLDSTFDIAAAANGMIQLSRIASRQVCAIAQNFSAYAWTQFRVISVFEEQTGIVIENGGDGYYQRFLAHPMQQTSYAAGEITNLALVSIIQEHIPAGKYFNFPAFVQFRIERTDYILGETLTQVALANLDLFISDTPPPGPLSLSHEVKPVNWGTPVRLPVPAKASPTHVAIAMPAKGKKVVAKIPPKPEKKPATRREPVVHPFATRPWTANPPKKANSSVLPVKVVAPAAAKPAVPKKTPCGVAMRKTMI